jgi:hypothetical protein
MKSLCQKARQKDFHKLLQDIDDAHMYSTSGNINGTCRLPVATRRVQLDAQISSASMATLMSPYICEIRPEHSAGLPYIPSECQKHSIKEVLSICPRSARGATSTSDGYPSNDTTRVRFQREKYVAQTFESKYVQKLSCTWHRGVLSDVRRQWKPVGFYSIVKVAAISPNGPLDIIHSEGTSVQTLKRDIH